MDDESQYATPLVAPPDMEAVESGKQTKLPLLSVVNLPLLDSPEQLYAEILTLPLVENDPPTPTLPDALRAEREVNPDTLTDDEKLAPDVTERDCPTPTLPETLSDDPIPTKPENLPVPNTSRAYTGEEVPMPKELVEELK